MVLKLCCTSDQRQAQGMDDKEQVVWNQTVGLSSTNLNGQQLEGQAEGVGNISLNMTLTGKNVGKISLGQVIDIPIGE